MTTETKRPSIRERIRAIDAGEPVIAAHFLKDEAALLLASGEVVVAGASDRRITCTRAAFSTAPPTARCSSPAAMTAGCCSGRQG